EIQTYSKQWSASKTLYVLLNKVLRVNVVRLREFKVHQISQLFSNFSNARNQDLLNIIIKIIQTQNNLTCLHLECLNLNISN
ncbi:hypothetical protein Bpfe_007997, partial [Biomphalaria pfeifferi]